MGFGQDADLTVVLEELVRSNAGLAENKDGFFARVPEEHDLLLVRLNAKGRPKGLFDIDGKMRLNPHQAGLFLLDGEGRPVGQSRGRATGSSAVGLEPYSACPGQWCQSPRAGAGD